MKNLSVRLGSSTGFFLIIGGLLTAYFSVYGAVISLIGAFIYLTDSSTTIDTEKKRIRYADNIFGFIPFGKWIDIEPGMKLGLKKSHKGYRSYARGMQTYDIHILNIAIYVYDKDKKPLFPVEKFKSPESAQIGLEEIKSIIGLDTLS